MPLPSTMTPIATNTLTATATDVTFSSIPQGYTDLVLVFSATLGTANQSVYTQYNGDTGTNYSYTRLTGDGTSASSARLANNANNPIGYTSSTTNPLLSTTNFNNYSNTTTYKTTLNRFGSAETQTQATVGLWRSTAAITSIKIYPSSGNFAAGSTFTIYGIKAA